MALGIRKHSSESCKQERQKHLAHLQVSVTFFHLTQRMLAIVGSHAGVWNGSCPQDILRSVLQKKGVQSQLLREVHIDLKKTPLFCFYAEDSTCCKSCRLAQIRWPACLLCCDGVGEDQGLRHLLQMKSCWTSQVSRSGVGGVYLLMCMRKPPVPIAGSTESYTALSHPRKHWL